MRLAIGSGRLIYPGDPSSPAESFLDSQKIFNSTISTPGFCLFCAEIKYIYEGMKIPLRWFPKDIIDQYKFKDLACKYGFVYVNICKGVYGLKQAARIFFTI